MSMNRSATIPDSVPSSGKRRCVTGWRMMFECVASTLRALIEGSGNVSGVYVIINGVFGECLLSVKANSIAPAR